MSYPSTAVSIRVVRPLFELGDFENWDPVLLGLHLIQTLLCPLLTDLTFWEATSSWNCRLNSELQSYEVSFRRTGSWHSLLTPETCGSALETPETQMDGLDLINSLAIWG